jgi:hypothetical protein
MVLNTRLCGVTAFLMTLLLPSLVACTNGSGEVTVSVGARSYALDETCVGKELCTVVAIAQGMDHGLQDPERA